MRCNSLPHQELPPRPVWALCNKTVDLGVGLDERVLRRARRDNCEFNCFVVEYTTASKPEEWAHFAPAGPGCPTGRACPGRKWTQAGWNRSSQTLWQGTTSTTRTFPRDEISSQLSGTSCSSVDATSCAFEFGPGLAENWVQNRARRETRADS